MLQCSRILLGYRGLMVNAASPMFEMSNVLPPHNLHFARPGSSSVLTHDMYFSICSQAWLNLHCKKNCHRFYGKKLAAELPEQSCKKIHPPVNLRSEEHTSELQSHLNPVCRLLLENRRAIRARVLRCLAFSVACSGGHATW